MKYLCLSLVALFFTLNSVAQDAIPSPTPKSELLNYIKKIPEEWERFHTAELTINEFHKAVDEVIGPNGEIIEGTDEVKLSKPEIIAVLLAEHYRLSDLSYIDILEKYGRPNKIYQTRKGSRLFNNLTPPFFDGYRVVNGKREGFCRVEIMECYEYDDFCVWLMEGCIVLAVSPRSARFEKYVKMYFSAAH